MKRILFSLLLAIILGFMLTGTAIAQTPSNTSSFKITAPSKSKKKLNTIEGDWNLKLKNYRFEDAYNQQTMTEFKVGVDMKYYPLESVHFRLAPKFTYTNGFVQSQEETEASSSKWGVKEASINAEPLSDIWLSAGALDQGKDHPALLLVDRAFPALRMSLQTDSKALFSAGIKGQSAIPTSSTLSAQTKEFEKTPSYSSGSMFMRLQRTVIEGTAQVGAYEFKHLPTSVATKSALIGNTPTPTSGTDSIFTYEYQGTFAAVDLKTHFSRYLTLTTMAEWAQNQKAPKELNQAVRGRTGLEIDFTSKLQMTPFYEYFRIEPDAVVAAYNGGWLNTNRIGYNAGIEMAFQKTLKVSIQAGERNVIFESATQHLEKTYYLTLETFDVAI